MSSGVSATSRSGVISSSQSFAPIEVRSICSEHVSGESEYFCVRRIGYNHDSSALGVQRDARSHAVPIIRREIAWTPRSGGAAGGRAFSCRVPCRSDPAMAHTVPALAVPPVFVGLTKEVVMKRSSCTSIATASQMPQWMCCGR